MEKKPTVSLWSLGEPEAKQRLYRALRGESANQALIPFVEAESEARRYRILSRPGAPTRTSGAILTLLTPASFSPRTRGLLLFASRFTAHLVVLLLSCDQEEDELDQREKTTRSLLSSLGFSGDAATILRESAPTPSEQTISRLLDALDASLPYSAPPQGEPDALPQEHHDYHRALALLQTKKMVRLKAMLSAGQDPPEKDSITSQLRGRPYLEAHEYWPRCSRCGDDRQVEFLLQLDARVLLRPAVKGAGLYVIYQCIGPIHTTGGALIIRHYEEPKLERRKKITGALRKPAPPLEVLSSFELELPSQDDLQNSDPYYGHFWRDLKKHFRREPAVIYKELGEDLGVEPAAPYQQAKPQMGGYSAPTEGARAPVCRHCKKLLRTLAGFFTPNFSYGRNCQLFFCECSPAEVEIIFPGPPRKDDPLAYEEREEDRRYQQSWE